MARVRLATFDALKPGGVDAPSERASGGVRTETVFSGERNPIHVRLHHLPAGERVGWNGSDGGHLAYVWKGTVTAAGARLDAGSMVAVEHGAGAEVVAAAGGATLLVFNRADDSKAPSRAGGHVHLLPADRVPRTARLNDRGNYGAAILADSACPTCELWLHESSFPDPDADVAPHSHNEDEVIVVTAGQIVLGNRRYGRGAALAIQRDTIYGFRAGPEGLTFINFRPSHPTYVTADGARTIDEQALYLPTLGRPPYLEPA